MAETTERRPPSTTVFEAGTWCVLAVAGVLYVAGLGSMQIGQYVDDGVCVSLGRSLHAGLGYVRFSELGHPVEPQYPPGLPALVAVTLACGGGPAAARLWPLFSTLAAVLLCAAFLRRRLPRAAPAWDTPVGRTLLLALFALNHLVMVFAGAVMTEAPFVLCCLAAAVVADRLSGWEEAAPARCGLGGAAGLGMILAAACWLRTSGLLLTAGLAAWSLRRLGRTATLTMLAVVALLVGPWLLAQHRATGHWLGAGYQADLTAAGQRQTTPARMVAGAVEYGTRLLPETVTPFFGERVNAAWSRLGLRAVPLVAGLIVTLAGLWGLFASAERRRDPLLWMLVPLALIHLGWPYRYTRFCLPLVPLFLVGLAAVAQRVTQRQTWLYACAALALVGFLARDLDTLRHPPRRRYPDLAAVARFVTAQTPADAVVLAENPNGLGLYTDRQLADILPAKRPDALDLPPLAAGLRQAAAHGRPYVLVFGDTPPQIAARAACQASPECRLVASDATLSAELYEWPQPPAKDHRP